MLNGTLDDFALADVFRLLSVAAKTGRLDVGRQAGSGKVFFAKGDVYYAESSIAREPLGQKLVRSGALTEGQLRRALDDHAATGRRLGQILLSSGTVSPPELEEAVRGQTEDAVFDLLRWERGEFSWQPGDEIDVEVPISVSVENLIMEASRRLDELDVIARKIPSADVLVAMAAKPPEGAVEINITPDEWRMLVLVNGTRTVGDIAQTVGLDDFSAMRTLYGLVSAGLVEVVSNSAGGGDVDREAISWRPGSGAEELVGGEPVPAPEEAEPGAVPAPSGESTVPAAEGARANASEAGVASEPDVILEPHVVPEPTPPEVAPAAAASDQDAIAPEEGEPASEAVVLEETVAGYSVAEPPPPAWFQDPQVDEVTAPAEEEEVPVTSSGEQSSPEPAEPPGPPAAARSETAEHDEEEPSPPSAEELPRLDRTAVVRELAGLFSEGEHPPGGAPRAPAAGSGEPDERKRVEDDDQVTKGLISRLIDGVKGL